MSDFVKVQTFYNGEVTLIYDDSLHQYTISEGKDRYVVPSATGVVAMIDKSGPLMPWAAKMVVEYIRSGVFSVYEGNTEPGSFNLAKVEFAEVRTQDEFENFLLDAKRNFRTISEKALDVGTLAHDWLEAYTQALIDKKEFNAPLPANENACKAITSALDWHARHNFRPVAAEQKVYSRRLNTAGTFDWIAVIDSCDDPKCCKYQFRDYLALGDYKSSKAIYEEYRAQTAFYKYAVDEMNESTDNKKIEARVILRLGKEDGEFEAQTFVNLTDYELDMAAFEGALAIYSWKEQLKLDTRAEKKKLKPLRISKKPVKRIKIPEVESIPVVSE